MPTLDLVKQPYEVAFSRNPILFRYKITPYGSDEAFVNTVITCELFAESEHYKNDFQLLKTVVLRADAQGFAEVDWSRLLDSRLEFYVPKAGSTNIQACRKQALRYYVRATLANDYEQLVAPKNSAILHCMKGGLAYEQSSPASFFDQKIRINGEFLRFGYTGESLAVNEPAYLYFMDPYGYKPGLAYLRATIGVVTEVGTPTQTVDAVEGGGKWQIYCLAIGYTQRNLEALVTGLPAGAYGQSIQVQVMHSNLGPVTRQQAFGIYRRQHYDTRTLHYHNSLGGFDTQVMRGEIEASATYEKNTVVRLDSGAYAQGRVLRALTQYDNPAETAQLKGETGWIPQARAERLRDLLNSRKAYETLPDGRLKPVLVSSKSVKLYSNREKLFSLAFDWEDAFSDPNFTPDGFLSGSGSCPDVEFLAAGQDVAALLRVSFQLPEGYDQVEIRFADTNTGVPAPGATTQFFVNANSGTVDLPVPYSNVNSYGQPAIPVYVWARVVCDSTTNPINAGPWKGSVTTNLSKMIAPAMRNAFAQTYQGSGARLLNIPSLKTYATGRNPGASLLLSVSSTSSAGGNVYDNPGNIIGYNPPSAGYSGVDIVTWQAVEQILVGGNLQLSPAGSGKLYITVGSVAATGQSATGKPYVRLTMVPGGRYIYGSSETVSGSLRLTFYKDPLGTILYDVTGLGLLVTVFPSSQRGTDPVVSYPSQTFSCSGTSTVLINNNQNLQALNDWKSYTTSEGDFTYTLAPLPDYHII